MVSLRLMMVSLRLMMVSLRLMMVSLRLMMVSLRLMMVSLHVETCNCTSLHATRYPVRNPLSRSQPVIPSATRYPVRNPLSRPQPVIPSATRNPNHNPLSQSQHITPSTIHNPIHNIKPFDINQNLCLPTLLNNSDNVYSKDLAKLINTFKLGLNSPFSIRCMVLISTSHIAAN